MNVGDRVRIISIDPAQVASLDPATGVGLSIGQVVTLVGFDPDDGAPLVLEDNAGTDCPWLLRKGDVVPE